MRLVFGFDAADPGLSDPHAVVIALSEHDADRWQAVQDREHPAPEASIGSYVRVTDLRTGDPVEVATAPCGLGCHCAAIVRRLS